MRRDVHKVIYERPKAGRTWESKTPRATPVLLDEDGEQLREESNHIVTEHQKGSNRRFNIVDRFLAANVGRPWDKVYSEICEVADSRNLLGAELREYLTQTVDTGRRVRGNGPACCTDLYVDRRTGILKKRPATPMSR